MATPDGLFQGMFLNEVKSMMYTFGDIKSPSSESALLIEDITLKEIRDLVKCSSEVSSIRGGKNTCISDLLFLFRRNKVKLKRIVRYMELKKLCRRASHSGMLEEDSLPDCDDAGLGENKKEKYSLDFLSKEDQAEILDDEVDEVQKQRLENLDNLTKDMDVNEYKEFSESRQVNFHKSMAKFKEWLDLSSVLPSVKISPLVYDLLSYLAYDTVQEIVELALVVKKDHEGRSCDLAGSSYNLSPSEPGTFPMFFNVPTSTTTTTTTTTTTNSTGSTSSPPTSPKSPAGSNSLSSPTQIITKPKPRKRGRPPKNPGLTSVSSEPIPVVTTPPAPPTAIQPHHVLEALRRCSTPLVGPMVPLKTYHSRSGTWKMFCT